MFIITYVAKRSHFAVGKSFLNECGSK